MTVVDRYQPPLNSVIMSTFYRTLGISSIHAPISAVVEFVNHPDNPFGGDVSEPKVGGPGPFELRKWKGINISQPDAEEPITFDSWIFGGPTNTVFVREHFYDLHLIRAVVEQQVGLEQGTLSAHRLANDDLEVLNESDTSVFSGTSDTSGNE